MKNSDRVSTDRVIGRLARRQQGVVSRIQLLAAGITRHEIHTRIQQGRLIILHPGVFAVGHDGISQEGRFIAGILAAGPGAAISHRSAAFHLQISARRIGRVEVVAPRSRCGDRNLIVHRPRQVHPADITVVRGIRTTTAPRTLLDLGMVTDRGTLSEAVRQAYFLRLADDVALTATMARYRGHRGAKPLREAADIPSGARLRSRAERRFLDALRGAALPMPLVNHVVLGAERDFVWPAAKLVVEVDGWEAHGHRLAFENDRERDAHMAEHGWITLRVTWRSLLDDPGKTARRVTTLLARAQPDTPAA